jgi:sugar/nucleoside kinase (ribokinase family)
MSLLVIGTVAYDAIETPFGKTDKIVGGAASFISLAASYYYPHIYLVSVVGDDYDQRFLQLLQSKGVDLSGLQIKKGEKSFFWKGKYHIDMNSRDTLDTQLNVLSSFDPVVPDAARGADFVMLGNLMPSLQIKVLRQLNHRPKLVMMDTMNFWISGAREALEEMLGYVDILSINDEEARQLAGDYSLRRCARAILAKGPAYLIVKKGENGALLFTKEGETFFFPAYPLEDVFDPTGAGDTFAGAIMGYIAREGVLTLDVLKEAIVQGTILAGICVERFGPEALLAVDESELQRRREVLLRMSHFLRLPA